jgi:hypothetical protein
MWEMAVTSIKLFLAGRLFQHPWLVVRKSAIGALLTGVLLIALTLLAQMPLLAAAGLTGLLGGILQPYLFRDLKYR